MPYLEYCRQRLADDPHLWASTLFDEVTGLGYEGGYSTFTRALRRYQARPHCEPCHAATGRNVAVIAHPPGEEIQFDWLELPNAPDGWGVGEHAHLLVGALAQSGRWRAVLAVLAVLAVQYGHMRTLISEGYGSRSRGGIHDLLDFETARNVAEQLSEVHEAIQDGEGVSGPAARRLVNAAAQEHHRFGGLITSVRQAKDLLADPTLNVFENKEAFLFCNYDRAKALCHPGRNAKSEAPSLDRCKVNCANIARTDAHAHQLREAADDLGPQAVSGLVPEPLADRLRERAQVLNELADQHDHDRVLAAAGADL